MFPELCSGAMVCVQARVRPAHTLVLQVGAVTYVHRVVPLVPILPRLRVCHVLLRRFYSTVLVSPLARTGLLKPTECVILVLPTVRLASVLRLMSA